MIVDYVFTLPETLIIKFTNDTLYERARVIHDSGTTSASDCSGHENRYFINKYNSQILHISKRNFRNDNYPNSEFYNIEMRNGTLVDAMFEELYGCTPDQSPFKPYKKGCLWVCSAISDRIPLQDYIHPTKTIPGSKGRNFSVGLEYNHRSDINDIYISCGINLSHYRDVTLENMVKLKDSRFKVIKYEPIRAMLATWDFVAKKVLQDVKHWNCIEPPRDIPCPFL